MSYLFIVWLLYYILEILNPNNVMAAWNINLTPYAVSYTHLDVYKRQFSS